ncbi:MAG: FmdB family zinc ribbon protein [Vicinamibacteria bacterium]
MPIFEYRCKKCETEFETLVRNGDRPECPSCRSPRLTKLLSTFAAVSGKGASRASSDVGPAACGTCGDPRGPGACSMN